MNSINRWEGQFAAVVRICGMAGGLVILLMTVMVTVDVIVRNVTGHPITGVFELSQVALLIATFLVLGYVQYYDRQLKADIFSASTEGRTRAAFRLLDGALGFLFFGILVWTGSAEWIKALNGNFLKRGLIDIPTVIPLGVLVAGTTLALLSLSLSILRSLHCLRTGESDEAPLESSGPKTSSTDITPHIDVSKP